MRLLSITSRVSLMILLVTTYSALASVPSHPALKICVATDADPQIRKAAADVLSAQKSQPLLVALAGDQPQSELVDSRKLIAQPLAERGYSHLILIGLEDDPLIGAAWQREAQIQGQDIYVFGFGHFSGDIGYIESDRNPFLHARGIPTAPFETQVITLTGTTPTGVALAVEAFLKKGIVNGVIAGDGSKRSRPSLLDRDPIVAKAAVPAGIPEKIGKAVLIGVSQAGEDEYRGVLQDAGVEPREIWRAKYYLPGAWDGAGANLAFEHYSNGLHRRAYGNSLWLARFESKAEAASAAVKIAAAAKLTQSKAGSGWVGVQPLYGYQKESPGPLSLWQHEQWVLMSTLPAPETQACRELFR